MKIALSEMMFVQYKNRHYFLRKMKELYIKYLYTTQNIYYRQREI